MQLKVTVKKKTPSPLLAAVGRRLTNKKTERFPNIAREVRPRTYHNHMQKRPEGNVKTQSIRVHFNWGYGKYIMKFGRFLAHLPKYNGFFNSTRCFLKTTCKIIYCKKRFFQVFDKQNFTA